MQFFRVSRNAYGQETLIGVSWDIAWWFIAAAALFIAVHIVYKWLFAPKAAGNETTIPET